MSGAKYGPKSVQKQAVDSSVLGASNQPEGGWTWLDRPHSKFEGLKTLPRAKGETERGVGVGRLRRLVYGMYTVGLCRTN